MIGDNCIKKKSKFCLFVCVLCFITTISQTPTLIDNFSTRNFVIPFWIIFAFVCLMKGFRVYIGNAKSLLLMSLFFAIYYLFGSVFIYDYMNSDLPYVIFLSIFILLIGLMTGRFLEKPDIEKICTVVIISGIIVCIDVFITYIYNSSLAGRLYIYDSKNSVSQILLTSWLLILFLKLKNKKIFSKIFYFAAFILLTTTLIGLKSRATLIAIPIVIMWIISHGNLDKRIRNIILILIGIVVIYLLCNPAFTNFLLNDILLGGRSSSNLNDISSGRMEEWNSFFYYFIDNPLFGHGRMKRESLILTSLLEFGIIGGGVILAIAAWPFIWSLKYLEKRSEYYLLFSSMAIVYIINGVFEQLAPFGPGVKCYFLWFLMGLLITLKRPNSNKQSEEEKKIER